MALLAVGANPLITVAMNSIRPGGRVCLFAQTQHEQAPFDPGQVCMDEKTLMGQLLEFRRDPGRGHRPCVFRLPRWDVRPDTANFSQVFRWSRRWRLSISRVIPQPSSMKIVLQP